MPNEAKTLHEAIELVLASQPNGTGSTELISREIARLKLWTRPKDGCFPEAFQIRLRARKPAYAHLFEMPDDQTVRLAKASRDHNS
jgi:predicted Rdx family selenoprotein